MIIFAAAVIFLFSVGLIFNPAIAVQGIKSGYSLCFDVLFPSLFPFMIISEILILTPLGKFLSCPLRIIFKALRLPTELAPLFLTSVLGGYPVGAKSLSILREKGEITESEAGSFIGFLINAGPGFTIMAVGKMIYGSLSLGIILYVSQIFASLLVGRLLYREQGKSSVKPRENKDVSYGEALVLAVHDGSQAMITICGYVFLFSVISAFINFVFKENIFALGITGLLEVTYGVGLVKNMHGGILFTAFLISFSGISVICQVESICQKGGIPTSGIVAIKFLQGICASAITFILLKFFPLALSAGVIAAAPIRIYSSDRILTFFCIASMFIMAFCNESNNVGKKKMAESVKL